MDTFIIEGGTRLQGHVKISGAKNASLAIMPTCLLAPGHFHLSNTPNNRDVWTFSRLLGSLGVHAELNDNTLHLDSSTITSFEAPYEHVKQMRASIYVLGPLLARYGQAKVSLPGGCNFGPRPVDLHLKGMEKLGAEITLEGGYINARAPKGRLQGARFHFDISSVGASVNVIMAAVLAQGHTTLTNAALEPEVTALARMLNKMGAKIEGIGTTTLEIQGVDDLKPVNEETIPDRIEAATFALAAALTRGNVTLDNVNHYHLTSVVQKLEESGATIDVTGESMQVSMNDDPEPVDITTATYPGFPTDTQAQWAAYMLRAKGSARITDTIYPTRFGYVPELHRLGASIEGGDAYCIVKGGHKLTGATVMSSDLRASASLVMAAMIAEGTSQVLRVYHIDRGYESIELKLNSLGARIRRERAEEE